MRVAITTTASTAAAPRSARLASPSLVPRLLKRGHRLPQRRGGGVSVAGPSEPPIDVALTGFVFQPFLELEVQMGFVDNLLSRGDVTTSAARTEYAPRLEAAVNEQINVELSMSYVYTALAAFFDRDSVGLPGFAARFAAAATDERAHAALLMAQQNRRGGRVALAPISRPVSEFFDEAKGDALHGAEVALALEKLNFLKLRQLHAVASEEGDAEMTQFVEDALLRAQAAEVKDAADLFSLVRRAGPGHGVVHIDLDLQRRHGRGLLGGHGLGGGAADGANGNGA